VKLGKLIIAILGVGVVANVFDFVVHGMILKGPVYSHATIMRTDMPMHWLIIGDFVAAAVFVIVYDRVYQSFGGGLKGGATFGLYAGVLVNFPTWAFSHLLISGFSRELTLAWTIVGILWGVVAGAVAGALYKR